MKKIKLLCMNFDFKMKYQFQSKVKGDDLVLELFPSGQTKLNFMKHLFILVDPLVGENNKLNE